MKTQTIAIIAIIAVGTLFGLGYATSTQISDSGIITPTLTITTPGGCIGCGGSTNLSYNVTSSDATNAVVISPTEFSFVSIYENSTSGYDGNIDVQQLQQDGSWSSIQSLSLGGRTVWFVDGLSGGPATNGGSSAIQYPFQFRAIVTLQASTGSALIEVNYIK